MEVAEQLRNLLQGVDRVVPESELMERLAEGRPLRVKLGMDPTAPKVTLGWAVVLRKLRQFQELGHTAVLIVGDFTAQVGDPSGQSEARRRLSADEVRAHAQGVLEGFRRLLLPASLEIRYNSEWLAALDMHGVLELTSKVTVAQLLQREDFRFRLEEGLPISLMEFLYPLLQGMDSVAVRADVELGGSDQLWNLLTGRDIQARYGSRPQIAMTVPLLVGTDGHQKMSQSLGNFIAIDDDPGEMFGKVMSLPDEAMPQYFRLATDLPETERESLIAALEEGTAHPGETKRLLGRSIVGLYWGEESALSAEVAFDRVFKEHGRPQEVGVFTIPAGTTIYLPRIMKEAGMATSNAEARRLIAQGAVRVDGEKVTVEELPRSALVGRVLQAGRRRFVRLQD